MSYAQMGIDAFRSAKRLEDEVEDLQKRVEALEAAVMVLGRLYTQAKETANMESPQKGTQTTQTTQDPNIQGTEPSQPWPKGHHDFNPYGL